jgi:hypothetical protein
MALNPNLMMIDGGDNSTPKSTLTQAQIQAAVRKLASGQPLTIEEQAAVGATSKAASTGYDWTEGQAELDQLAAEARAAADEARTAAAGAKTAAEKAIADKLKETADAKAAAEAAARAKAGVPVTPVAPAAPAVVSNTATGLKTDAQIAAEAAAAKATGERQSAYDLLYSEFSKYGLQSLVAPLKGLITTGASPAEFTIKLRESPEYQKRFAGNAQRIAKGLTAIDEATYLAKEDAYQGLMRNYGLPESYWKTGDLGTQEGFTKLIANDVSAVELENRLQTAQQRVLQSNPEVAYTLKAFYPDITNGDILAYALDPKNALDSINRKVTAAEIGGAALAQGLSTSLGGAEGLAAYGITKAQAQQGYQNVAGMVPRGSQLADIYGQQPYNQGTAEAEVFGTAGAEDAKKRREKLISLESASFGGSSGVGALGRDKNIYGAAFGQTGQY